MTEQTNCVGCGGPLPVDKVLCSISHTISPGATLCSDCGIHETLDAAWANGMRVGILRAERAAREARGVQPKGVGAYRSRVGNPARREF
jgi:hypothetical protein